MEALYQEYKDHVNFLWVYGSEAHPEEHPFAEGYESSDLGWEHPYTITLDMAERAQRALWMKTDPEPDFEIPMVVDYVNHLTEPDNAIRNAYRGGGFYSGFVVDCDGIVKVAHGWGWYAPGGEWWGLPLAPVSELRNWLDAYLANPPVCYTGEAVPLPDGGVGEPDAGSGPDATAGLDAGVTPTPDAGDDDGGGNAGGCSASGAAGVGGVGGVGGAPLGWLALGLGLAFGLRRRRRQRRQRRS